LKKAKSIPLTHVYIVQTPQSKGGRVKIAKKGNPLDKSIYVLSLV